MQLNKQNWQIKKLGEVCEINIGKTPLRSNDSYWDKNKKSNNVWLSISDLKNTKDKIIYDSKEYISEKAQKNLKIIEKGTLLVSFKLTLGRLAFAGENLYTNEAIASLPIKNKKQIDNNFLYWYLSFFDWNKAARCSMKVKGLTLNKNKLNEIEVFIPSLSEQQQIVTKLDSIYSDCQKLKNNYQKIIDNCEELKKSILNDIFSLPESK